MYAGEPKAPALKCSKEQAHGAGSNADWHRDMLQSMMASRFCMVVPGDSQSSERLTDAFVSGAGLAGPNARLAPLSTRRILPGPLTCACWHTARHSSNTLPRHG